MDFDDDSGEFSRLHNLFTFHLGIAVTLSWLTSLYAALLRSLGAQHPPPDRPDHVGTVESTWSFLFIFPVVLTAAWLISVFGQNLFARFRILKSQAVEFAIAGPRRLRDVLPVHRPRRRGDAPRHVGLGGASHGPARSFACAGRFLPTSRESFMAQAKGYGDPHGYNAPLGTETFVFRSNGIVPNSSLPLIVRRGAIPPSEHDPAKAFKATFARNGWTNAWLDGIHDFHHYHSNAHEVLGIVSGSARVRFGGEDGDLVGVTAGDVVVIPAGVAHALHRSERRLRGGRRLSGRRRLRHVRDDPGALAASQQRIAQVPVPDADPVDGADGPLVKLWT